MSEQEITENSLGEEEDFGQGLKQDRNSKNNPVSGYVNTEFQTSSECFMEEKV